MSQAFTDLQSQNDQLTTLQTQIEGTPSRPDELWQQFLDLKYSMHITHGLIDPSEYADANTIMTTLAQAETIFRARR